MVIGNQKRSYRTTSSTKSVPVNDIVATAIQVQKMSQQKTSHPSITTSTLREPQLYFHLSIRTLCRPLDTHFHITGGRSTWREFHGGHDTPDLLDNEVTDGST